MMDRAKLGIAPTGPGRSRLDRSVKRVARGTDDEAGNRSLGP